MIDYKEKGHGLHVAIEAAGHWLRETDGKWVSSDDDAVQALIDAYTLDQCKSERAAESLAISKALRDAVVASISPGEMAAWPIKRAEAVAYAASGRDEDAPLLSAEAAARGITLPAMLAKVSENAQYFAGLEARIGGADGKHRDKIALLEAFEDVAAYDLSVDWPKV